MSSDDTCIRCGTNGITSFNHFRLQMKSCDTRPIKCTINVFITRETTSGQMCSTMHETCKQMCALCEQYC